MSAQANKEIVERLLTAFSNSDAVTAEQVLAEDFINHDPPNLPGVGKDRAGVLTATEYLHSAFENARAELVCVVADGDRVAVHDRLRGRHRADFLGIAPTGHEISVDFIHIFRVTNGRIVERWGVADSQALVDQLGAAPDR
jgi:predicted ester cyclase